jgi:IS30 family transposase
MPPRSGTLSSLRALACRLRPRHILTWDQGNELAHHEQVGAHLQDGVFFAYRASPWMRGTNENTNGLLRQHFPKGSDLSVHGSRSCAACRTGSTTDPARPSAGRPQQRPSMAK